MRTTVFIVCLLFVSTGMFAQQIGCVDKSIRLQGEQMKHEFKAQGMDVYKDAMLTMVPKEPYPIAIQLAQNEVYQFIYVGAAGNDLVLELYDGADKKLSEKTVQSKAGNFMIYSFKPEKPDLYLVILKQKGKGKKEVCASFSVMKNASNIGR